MVSTEPGAGHPRHPRHACTGSSCSNGRSPKRGRARRTGRPWWISKTKSRICGAGHSRRLTGRTAHADGGRGNPLRVRPSCVALGVAPATYYWHQQPVVFRPHPRRPSPPRTLRCVEYNPSRCSNAPGATQRADSSMICNLNATVNRRRSRWIDTPISCSGTGREARDDHVWTSSINLVH